MKINEKLCKYQEVTLKITTIQGILLSVHHIDIYYPLAEQ